VARSESLPPDWHVDEFNAGPITDTDPAPNRVLEHSPLGTPVGITAFASDGDSTTSAITYSLFNTRGGRFAINPVTGVVTIANAGILDREVQAVWSITVLATSQDGSVSVKEFTVELVDVDEFNVGKVFDLDPAPSTVVENAPNGTPVGITGFGIDLDATNNTVTYSLWNTRAGRFAIDPTTGVVTVANGALIDREAQGTWSITILATSSDGSIGVKEFAIAVQDVDEYNVGKVFDLDPAANTVLEHAASGTPVGITGFGIDLDATNSNVTYSLWNTRPGRFAIDPATGVVTVASGAILDREVAAAWTITILATSQDGSVSVKDFTIAVQDVDEFDVGQVFDLDSNPNRVAENAANGTAVGIRGFGIDLDATTNAVTYLLADDAGGRFVIDSVSGVVRVANTSLLDWEAVKSWAITIRATSTDGSEGSKVFWITLLDVVD